MDLMMQRSSDTLPMCGNSSHICCPDFPNVLKPCCGPKQINALPCSCAICCPLVIDSGIGLPLNSRSLGLKSNVSRCDGPPAWYRKITRLALAGKSVAPRSIRGLTSEFKATNPSPAAPRPKNVRRLTFTLPPSRLRTVDHRFAWSAEAAQQPHSLPRTVDHR